MSQIHSRVSRTSGTKAKKNTCQPSSQSPLQNSASDNDEVHCIICAEKIVYSAISPCNNVTCHVCSFRQRALYKRKTCLVCRTDHDDIIFTEKVLEDVKFSDFVPGSRSIHSSDYEIHFTTQYVKEDTLKLMSYECPVCQEKFKKFNQLNQHTKTEHNKQYCDTCVDHGNTFISELSLFTQKELQRHMNEGDKDGFTGHPKCKFCRGKRFYSEDELNIHIRDRHERCYICNQDNYQVSDYYRNYDDLYEHFRNVHYVCSVPSCVEKRFVVFREDLDLTAHMLKEHGGIMGSSGRLVIGATSSHFQSQLSTFSRPQTNSSRDSNSFNLKKRRLDERVKHYLLNDVSKISKFGKINSDFKSRRISASDLVKQYTNLFSDNDTHEIALVLYEFIELQPEHSDYKASLQLAYDQMNASESAPTTGRSFPLLSKSSDRHLLKNSSWGTGLGSSKKSLEEQFPALVKPPKTKQAINTGPIKYTVIKKKPAAETKPSVARKTFKENTSYRPSYLETPRSDSSNGSLPILGSSSGTFGSSASVSRQTSRPESPASIGSSAKLSQAKFPALEAKKKKVIPPVKPIPQPVAGWGPGLVRREPEPTHDWGIPIIDKKAEKLKRKAERANSKDNSKNK
ncbi:hypothetical protein JCM33374_g6347 [Metschnikowia sp. JCM 33374]|nr:hypothetical protein JCM33374_g6347 [Metschnikowia sp. JCM 33374]